MCTHALVALIIARLNLLSYTFLFRVESAERGRKVEGKLFTALNASPGDREKVAYSAMFLIARNIYILNHGMNGGFVACPPTHAL